MNVKIPCHLGAAVGFLAICLSFAITTGATGSESAPVGNVAEDFPALPAARTPVPGIEFYRMQIPGSGPGRPMELNLYLPAGQHRAKSLPCVLIAPAGSGEHGGKIEDSDRPEHVPYVRAGFAVMAYELSGAMAEEKKSYTYGEMKEPVTRFMEAEGGLINGRTAIDYVLSKVPEVDPGQLFACGHSSAATVALNLARGDGRIRACCAYAPGVDVEKWWNNADKMERVVPGFRAFPAKHSPLRHVAEFNCPVYLFHADDDSLVSLADTQEFVEAMQAAGKKITFERVATGEHYQSMIDKGIPGGIKFMESQGAKPMPSITGAAGR